MENMIERAVALGRPQEEVQAWDLCGFASCPYLGNPPQETCGFCSEGLTPKSERGSTIGSLAVAREQFERQYILNILGLVQGSRTEAARMLGVSRKALWEKCKRYGISSGAPDRENE
jgi:DNA-binding NtrC family response regulator